MNFIILTLLPLSNEKKPEAGRVKVNTDAAFAYGDSTGHWGAIIRNHTGDIITSAWSPTDRCQSAEEAEAIAALEGIRLSINLNLPVILECNCQSVVTALNSNSSGRSQASLVHAEAAQVIKNLIRFKVQHVPRSANCSAHTLAAYSSNSLCNGVLHFDAPACVLKQVMRDCKSDSSE